MQISLSMPTTATFDGEPVWDLPDSAQLKIINDVVARSTKERLGSHFQGVTWMPGTFSQGAASTPAVMTWRFDDAANLDAATSALEALVCEAGLDFTHGRLTLAYVSLDEETLQYLERTLQAHKERQRST